MPGGPAEPEAPTPERYDHEGTTPLLKNKMLTDVGEEYGPTKFEYIGGRLVKLRKGSARIGSGILPELWETLSATQRK